MRTDLVFQDALDLLPQGALADDVIALLDTLLAQYEIELSYTMKMELVRLIYRYINY